MSLLHGSQETRARLRALTCLCALLIGSLGACHREELPDDPKPEPEPAKEEPAASAKAEPQPEAKTDQGQSTAANSSGAAEGEVTSDGYQLVRARTSSGTETTLSMKAPKGWEIQAAPNAPDPHAGKFSLAEATKGLPKQGTLAAQIKTNMGSFYCDLYEDKAPNTVANFLGLARGLRKFWDANKLEWTAHHYYDGTTFHRVIPTFMIQGGDYTGTGRGNIGYVIHDEVAPDLHHDRPGQLCMANRGKNTNEAQFFITEGAAPHLEGSYSIFGQCQPATLVQRIARVPQGPGNRPLTPVTIDKVEIKRIVGGATKWMPESAKLPPMPNLAPPGRALPVGH